LRWFGATSSPNSTNEGSPLPRGARADAEERRDGELPAVRRQRQLARIPRRRDQAAQGAIRGAEHSDGVEPAERGAVGRQGERGRGDAAEGQAERLDRDRARHPRRRAVDHRDRVAVGVGDVEALARLVPGQRRA
jgi:hypothetical protein